MRRRVVLLAALAAALVAAAPAAAAKPQLVRDGRDSSGELDIQRASFLQEGPQIHVAVTTWHAWGATTLRSAAGRSLCIDLTQRTGSRVCVAPAAHDGGFTLVREPLDAAGNAGSPRALTGEVQRRDSRTVVMSFAVADAGLGPGAIGWQVVSTWTGGACTTAATPGCTDFAPDSSAAHARIAPFRVIGCRARSPWALRSGPKHRRKEIALSFDDGPAADTPQYLDILEREHVPATFFMIGRQVAGHDADLRRMLRDGDMIGDHTWDHANVAGGATWEIDRTQAAIRQASGGFTPCLFRPPYGAVGPNLIADARARGLDTILWNDDPQDWRMPGTDAIFNVVMSEATPDGIVLMHDGGGPRQQTIAALPRIIHALRARGYTFVTVADLLGLQLVYG